MNHANYANPSVSLHSEHRRTHYISSGSRCENYNSLHASHFEPSLETLLYNNA